GRWLLRRVAEGPILRGLWLPPFAERDPALPQDEQARQLVPIEAVAPAEVLPPVRHAITYRRISVVPVRLAVDGASPAAAGWSWADPASPKLPTSSLLAKLLRSVRG
ncbi:MAG TPA: hypothetical protein VLT32_06980, partial [Candidatus Sulfomarinibacteraceae bacterium]|nr:hypothetical protein [Candidatus Sulfomarinibacteraceae bacterium]